MKIAKRVSLLLNSQYHATNATALRAQALGNTALAQELRDTAEEFDRLAEAVDSGLLGELEERAMTKRLFEANGVHIDFSGYAPTQLTGQACSSCGADLKVDDWTETTLLGPIGRMRRHSRWQDCNVEAPF